MEFPMKGVLKFQPNATSKGSEQTQTSARIPIPPSPNIADGKRDAYLQRVLRTTESAFCESSGGEKSKVPLPLPKTIKTLDNEYDVIPTADVHRIENGRFTRVRNVKTGRIQSMKLKLRSKSKPNEGNFNTERLFLSSIAIKLDDRSLLVHLHDVGVTDDFKFLVVDDLGPDLLYYGKRCGVFNTVTAFLITYYSFWALRELHSMGYLHCDLRPSSFCISSPFHLRLVDFYCIQPIKAKPNSILKPDRFSSRAVHSHNDLDESADIESWLYTMMFLTCQGSLPWNNQDENDTFSQKQAFFKDRSKYSWRNSADCLNLVPMLLEKYRARASDKIAELLEVCAMGFDDDEQPQWGDRLPDEVLSGKGRRTTKHREKAETSRVSEKTSSNEQRRRKKEKRRKSEDLRTFFLVDTIPTNLKKH